MTPFLRALSLALSVLFLHVVAAEEPPLESQNGVLVLRNGYVLQGRITPVNDMFLVSLGESGEVRLPRSDVEFQCRDLDEAYLQQRNALRTDEPAEHLRLAEWCLRHRLLARAADQLLIVYLQDPNHSRLAGLERRLQSLSVQSLPSTFEATTPATPIPPVSHSAPKLSPQLLQQFTTVVQPILLNRCAAYTCHGNGSDGSFRLIRPSAGHATTSRVTHRNLQATQSFIDAMHPEESPLLTQAAIAHGGAKMPAFAEKNLQQQWELIAAWVRRAATKPPEAIAANRGGPQPRNHGPAAPTAPAANRIVVSAEAPVTIPTPSPGALVAPAGHFETVAPASSAAGKGNQAGPAPSVSIPPPSPHPSATLPAATVPNAAAPAGDRRGAVPPAAGLPAAAPRDPFDPALFNQQFHPRS